MQVLVTGGAGFIGGNLCRVLVSAGHQVTVLDDLSSGFATNLHGLDVDLRVGSILDDAQLQDAARGAAAIVHLAARASVPRSLVDPEATHLVNATGTLRVVEAARAVGAHLVVASSSSVYGANPAPAKHELLPVAPLSPYGASKLAAEAYALAFQHSFGVPVLAFRFFNVFGPLQAAGHVYAAVVPAFVDAALSGQPLQVFGDGLQTRDFTAVETVVEVIASAIEGGVTHPGPVNLAFGTTTTLLELIALLERRVGRSLDRVHLPVRTGDIPFSRGDGSLLRSLFPTVVPADLWVGLDRTVSWFEDSALAAP